MAYGYRLFGFKGFAPVTAANPDGVQLALAEMDPDPLNVANGHRNVWVESPLDNRQEWVQFFGPIQYITRKDSWDTRSNDANRIRTFPPEPKPSSGGGGSSYDDTQVRADIAGVAAQVTALDAKVSAFPPAPTKFNITGEATA